MQNAIYLIDAVTGITGVAYSNAFRYALRDVFVIYLHARLSSAGHFLCVHI